MENKKKIDIKIGIYNAMRMITEGIGKDKNMVYTTLH